MDAFSNMRKKVTTAKGTAAMSFCVNQRIHPMKQTNNRMTLNHSAHFNR